MFETYLSSGFLIAHITLMVIYLIVFVCSMVLQRRETLAAKILERQGIGDLAQIGLAAERMPQKSVLLRQLKTALALLSRGAELKTHTISEQVAQSISWLDGIIRYCINGFVVVGLMGTLYAFYEMWHNAGATGTPISSDLYLANMARALSVSFFGLVLALIAGSFFSLLRASRQRLIGSLAYSLDQLDNTIPADAKTNLLLTRLLEPLDNLVKQLTIQNDKVLTKLTATVDQRTEQLNKLIEDSTNSWRSTIKDFKQETLTAVGGLERASNLLSASSKDVADTMKDVTSTMKDVSQGLERTKDIGLIIERMEATSDSLIARLAEKLEKGTHAWAKKLSAATKQQRDLLEQQPKALEKMIKGLTVRAVDDFKSTTSEVITSLNQMQADFSAITDAVASKWMTSMSAGNKETTDAMSAIVNGWHDTVTNTTASINTALGSSGTLINSVLENMKLMNLEIRTLQAMVEELKSRAGAPLILNEVSTKLTSVTNEFSAMNLNLKSLVNGVTQNSGLGDLHRSVEANSGLLKNLLDNLKTLKPDVNGYAELLEGIVDINARLVIALARLEEIGEAASAFQQSRSAT